jgi:hypothetical protein
VKRRVVAFDLDNTLAESKSPITGQIADLLEVLLEKFQVCVISCGKFEQFEEQLLNHLNTAPRTWLPCTSCPRAGRGIELALFGSLEELWDPAPGYWDEHLRNVAWQTVIRPSEGALSVGAPPLPTENGLLFFFHEREKDNHYATRVALLNDQTGRVLSLLPDPIMRPELPWECTGDIDNIIFVQGAISRPDGTIYLTYGAANRCVGAASVTEAELQMALNATAIWGGRSAGDSREGLDVRAMCANAHSTGTAYVKPRLVCPLKAA